MPTAREPHRLLTGVSVGHGSSWSHRPRARGNALSRSPRRARGRGPAELLQSSGAPGASGEQNSANQPAHNIPRSALSLLTRLRLPQRPLLGHPHEGHRDPDATRCDRLCSPGLGEAPQQSCTPAPSGAAGPCWNHKRCPSTGSYAENSSESPPPHSADLKTSVTRFEKRSVRCPATAATTSASLCGSAPAPPRRARRESREVSSTAVPRQPMGTDPPSRSPIALLGAVCPRPELRQSGAALCPWGARGARRGCREQRPQKPPALPQKEPLHFPDKLWLQITRCLE